MAHSEEYRASGDGYYDHNWGNVPMHTLMHDWYWARAKAGPYTVIASHITATKAYGYKTQNVYMLAKDDEIIADDEAKVSFEMKHVATDRKTGKPVADVTRYTYRDGDARYVVTFERQKTILQAVFTERMPFIKRLIGKIVGFDGARFKGKRTSWLSRAAAAQLCCSHENYTRSAGAHSGRAVSSHLRGTMPFDPVLVNCWTQNGAYPMTPAKRCPQRRRRSAIRRSDRLPSQPAFRARDCSRRGSR